MPENLKEFLFMRLPGSEEFQSIALHQEAGVVPGDLPQKVRGCRHYLRSPC